MVVLFAEEMTIKQLLTGLERDLQRDLHVVPSNNLIRPEATLASRSALYIQNRERETKARYFFSDMG